MKELRPLRKTTQFVIIIIIIFENQPSVSFMDSGVSNVLL